MANQPPLQYGTDNNSWLVYSRKVFPPRLISDGYTGAFGGMAVIVPQDVSYEAMAEAVLARCQNSSTSPDDVLNILGQEATMSQYSSESNDEFRLRLANKWSWWKNAGNDSAILNELHYIGYADSYLLYNIPGGGQGAPNNIPYFPASATYWSEFQVMIVLPTGAVGNGADGFSKLLSPLQIGDIRSAVNTLKPVDWALRQIVVIGGTDGVRYDAPVTVALQPKYDDGVSTYDAAATSTVEFFRPF